MTNDHQNQFQLIFSLIMCTCYYCMHGLSTLNFQSAAKISFFLFTEITTLENKDVEQANELIQIAEDKNKLEQKRKQFETELSKLESTKWVDLVQAERQAEAKIRSEILEFKSQTTKVGSELKNLQNKLNSLEKDIENEKNELKEEKEKQELEEKQLKEEVEKVKVEIKTLSDTGEADQILMVKIENDLKELSEELDRKKEDVVQLEKKLKDVNMREFKQVTPMGSDKGKPSDSGEGNKLNDIFFTEH